MARGGSRKPESICILKNRRFCEYTIPGTLEESSVGIRLLCAYETHETVSS